MHVVKDAPTHTLAQTHAKHQPCNGHFRRSFLFKNGVDAQWWLALIDWSFQKSAAQYRPQLIGLFLRGHPQKDLPITRNSHINATVSRLQIRESYPCDVMQAHCWLARDGNAYDRHKHMLHTRVQIPNYKVSTQRHNYDS